MARAFSFVRSRRKFGIFPNWGTDDKSPGAGEATFRSSFRAVPSRIIQVRESDPMPIPGFGNLAPLRSMPIRLCSNGCRVETLDPTAKG